MFGPSTTIGPTGGTESPYGKDRYRPLYRTWYTDTTIHPSFRREFLWLLIIVCLREKTFSREGPTGVLNCQTPLEIVSIWFSIFFFGLTSRQKEKISLIHFDETECFI